jgi:phosphoribosylanthranilate isomerase
MNRLQIKICGTTSVRDAAACMAAGVDMIGLNFYPRSPRVIAPTVAREIVQSLPANTEAVGVFVDPRVDEVRAIAKAVGIRAVQLHGEIPPLVCRSLTKEFRVIRAFQTTVDFRPESVALFPDCDILLDAYHPNLRGGTGQTCDWSIAAETRHFARCLILSGGLNAQNISAALAAVRPHAVDVCSSVEAKPGIKDQEAIKKFVGAVRAQ